MSGSEDRNKVLGNFCKKPWITIQKIGHGYSLVSLDTYNTNYDVDEEGVEILRKYLDMLLPHMKKGSCYGYSRVYSSCTVRNGIAAEVAQSFLDVYNKHKIEIQSIAEMLNAATKAGD